ncbi:MAG: DHHW family protein [Mobilitalea sp.]
MKFTFNRIFFLVFTVLWSAFILWNLITPAKVFSENENRYLAAIPEFTFDKFIKGDYMNGINDYINDQFVLRDDWISIKTMLERVMLKQDINSVYFAKDGYLIEKHTDKEVSEQLAEKNKEYLVQFVDKYISKLGKDRVKAILVPTASEILTDKLPLFATGYDQNKYMDKLMASLPEGTFLDLRDTLMKHKNEYIYYRTDHHWTALGAYYSYEHWCKETGIKPLKKEQFDIILATDEFYGTLHSKVNVKVKPDEIYLYQMKEDMDYQLLYNLTDKTNSLYDYSKLKGKDKYSVYMGGNNPVVEIETNNKNGRKLLVIKDSFAHSFVPFVVNHFEKTYMIDFRYFNGSMEAYVEENGITDVLVLYNTMSFVKDDFLAKLIK